MKCNIFWKPAKCLEYFPFLFPKVCIYFFNIYGIKLQNTVHPWAGKPSCFNVHRLVQCNYSSFQPHNFFPLPCLLEVTYSHKFIVLFYRQYNILFQLITHLPIWIFNSWVIFLYKYPLYKLNCLESNKYEQILVFIKL